MVTEITTAKHFVASLPMLVQRFATKFKYFDKATSTTPLFVSIIMTYLSVCGLFYQLEVGCEGNCDVTGVRLFLTSGTRGLLDSCVLICCEFSSCCALAMLLSHLQLL